MNPTPYLVLVADIESSGIDPESEHLLEVAAEWASGPEGRGSFSRLVLPDRFTDGYQIAPYLEALNPYVFEMHTKSGLLEALAQLGNDRPRPSIVDAHLYRWIRGHVEPDAEGKLPEIRLGGFSVDFDLRWIKRHLPMTASLLSRRVVDFSQLADFCVAAGLPDAKYPNGREGAPEPAHRALADVRAALDTYRRALDLIRPRVFVGADFARHDDQVDSLAFAVFARAQDETADGWRRSTIGKGAHLSERAPEPRQAVFSPVCPDGQKAERERSKIASFSTPEAFSAAGRKPVGVKRRWSLLDPLRPTLAAVVDVLMHGNTKYEPHTWQLVEPSQFRDALDRHWHDFLNGVQLDEHSGLPHLAHVVCNALFLAWFERNTVETSTDGESPNGDSSQASDSPFPSAAAEAKYMAIVGTAAEPDPILEELPDPALPRCGDIVFFPVPNDQPRAVGVMGEDTILPGLVDVWIDSSTRVAVGRERLTLAWDAPLDLLEAFAGRHAVADRAPLLSPRARTVLEEKKKGSPFRGEPWDCP